MDDEFAALLGIYVRAGETTRTALLKSLRLRATADGHLDACGRIKRGTGGRAETRRPS
jgi:hypothetical protein